MGTVDFYCSKLGIDPSVLSFVNENEKQISKHFIGIQERSEFLQGKVLHSMKECKISQRHFYPSTGYGYGDEGRDTLDRLFASIFGGQDALVRSQWVSGTHVLSDCLYAFLRPGDTMMSISGKPYDTLNETIGHESVGGGNGSLKDWGISYIQIDLTHEGKIDIPAVLKGLEGEKIKLVFIQRSRGYEWRHSLSVEHMGEAIRAIKKRYPHVIILVDNCYGEFTETVEPSHVGADITAGSLIKNPGGGVSPTGGYAVGTKDAIEALSYRLTSPSLGRELGSYTNSYMPFYQGIFMAPHIVGEALKGAILSARVFESLGYNVMPGSEDPRSDIIQSVRFNSDDELIAFCQAIQAASPVDGHVVPYPWDMPGYSHPVIMAAGTFIQGASIELSADAPVREPYNAYIQGGLTYSHIKLALAMALTQLKTKGYLTIK